MDKTLILYENKKFLELFKNKKKILIFEGVAFDIHNCVVYNPPFFKNIIYESPKNKKDILISWNAVIINGYLIIPHDFVKFLPESKYKITYLNKNKYAYFKKIQNINYIIYDSYRNLDFSIIGVEKGGTTSLLSNLSKHPDIFMAKPKHHPGRELHYYDFHIFRKGKDIEWFKSHFDYKSKIVGSKNPNTIYIHSIHPFLSKLNPFIRLIIVLRNPIDRAYSEWHMFNHMCKYKNKNFTPFKNAIQDEIDFRLNEEPNFYVSNKHHLQRGLYYKQIKNLLKFFPMQNLMIILNDDLKNNENETYEKIYQFLNVKIKHSDYQVKLEGTYLKKQKEKDITPSLRKKMINFFLPDVRKLEKLLDLKTNWF